MRLEVLQALALVAALHASQPLVAPETLTPDQLTQHVDQRVALEGRIADVDPGDTVTSVTLAHEGARATVLTRDPPPPLGASVRVTGDASPDRGGVVLWAETWSTRQAPDRAPLGVERAAEEAPRRAGTTVTVVGTWLEDASVLTEDGARLPVEPRTAPPPDGEEIAAWGLLAYAPEAAEYRLQAAGWSPWNRSQG